MKKKPISRRRFLGGLLPTILATSIAPRLIPMRLLAGESVPSKTIHLGHIGVGFQGTNNLRNFLSQTSDIAASVAICDPYRERREKAAAHVREAQKLEPKLYSDFRELLGDKSIDAVIVSTPDHWHVPIGLAAVRAGKDVYIEKPLGHSLSQNRSMLEACKKHDRIFQYGTQQRSMEMIRRGVELVLNGYIGELQRLEVWCDESPSGGDLTEIPVPEGLDYDLYIGPAPMRPCTAQRITNLGSWFCADYSLGYIAGWGAHPLDVAIWGMQSDLKGPYSVRGTGTLLTPDRLFNTYNRWDTELRFADGVLMRFMSDNVAKPVVEKYCPAFHRNGTTFFGTKGWVSISREGICASNPEWLKLRQCAGDKRVLSKPRYYRAFVECVRDRAPSMAPIQDAVRSDAISHLSVLALKNNTELVWDPQAYQIKSPLLLNQQMTCAARGEWQQS